MAISKEAKGMLLGLVGVAMFSLTLPLSRVVVTELDPLLVGFARSLIGGLFAAFVLMYKRAPLPSFAQFKTLMIIALGVVFGFPIFITLAMAYVPASHGAIVLGMLPLTTALIGALRFGEKPSVGFWVCAVTGSALIVAYIFVTGAGHFSFGDGALVLAVLSAAVGYAEGAHLTKKLGGVNVISWALVITLPIVLPVTLFLVKGHSLHASWPVWLCFSYLATFSAYISFFFWYEGLAMGGIARVGQVQLTQPFLGLLGGWLLINDVPSALTFVFAVAVFFVVMVGKTMPVRRIEGVCD